MNFIAKTSKMKRFNRLLGLKLINRMARTNSRRMKMKMTLISMIGKESAVKVTLMQRKTREMTTMTTMMTMMMAQMVEL